MERNRPAFDLGRKRRQRKRATPRAALKFGSLLFRGLKDASSDAYSGSLPRDSPTPDVAVDGLAKLEFADITD